MKKVLGIVLTVAGFGVLIVSKIPKVLEKFSFLPQLILDNLLPIGIVCLVIGVVLLALTKNFGKTISSPQEIPIYQGKQIVGYRRS